MYAVNHLELGIPVQEIARECGFSEKAVCLWPRNHNGVSPSELKRLKELDRENSPLKRLVAELSLDKEIL